MEIKDIKEYIDKKIVESIKREEIDSIEFQEVLEKIDSMLDEIK